jgi:ABC-type Fe3+-siderophore transport system permease subunit
VWIELMMQNAPGANTPGKQMAVLVFGLVLAGAGVVELVRPDLLTKLLRRNSKEGDIRLVFAHSMDRRLNVILVGAAAILWGLLFAGLMINMLLNPGT